ncbi:hypothetical protein PoB_006114300 [Plakobranchus ocellatus]|uniref:Uncharacterized protein n=1 Tax=Plakobranchus ocellatus TaxID=259542 RepID=A0AAV4CS10_9GAST|nr:hypothetical protein PoB_006114300 [Plakobranchus ocellatus]
MVIAPLESEVIRPPSELGGSGAGSKAVTINHTPGSARETRRVVSDNIPGQFGVVSWWGLIERVERLSLRLSFS